MKFVVLAVALCSLAPLLHAQNAKDITLGLQVDIVKSDYNGYFERVQTGVEASYFVSEKFSATAGIEYWSEHPQFSGVIGARWFPVPEAFVRVRGLFGANDISIGGGWVKPLKDNLRFEAMGDIYFEGHIAIRAGLAYRFRNKSSLIE